MDKIYEWAKCWSKRLIEMWAAIINSNEHFLLIWWLKNGIRDGKIRYLKPLIKG